MLHRFLNCILWALTQSSFVIFHVIGSWETIPDLGARRVEKRIHVLMSHLSPM